MGPTPPRFSSGLKTSFAGNIETDCNWAEEIPLGGFANFTARVEPGATVTPFSASMAAWASADLPTLTV